MDFGDVLRVVDDLASNHCRFFVMALISLEKGITDEDLLASIYDEYMKRDHVTGLLGDDFDDIVSSLR